MANESVRVFRFVLDRLKSRGRVAFLVVTESRGETPGRAGFKMAVSSGGALCGTIGGGAVEHDLVEEAKGMLKERNPRPVVRRKVHRPPHPETSGMICGGEQTVAVYPCRASERRALESILRCLERGTEGLLTISPEGLVFARRSKLPGKIQFTSNKSDWTYSEPTQARETLYIIGGGHVGLALSRAMAPLDFRIVVLDERRDVGTLAENVYAHEKRVVPFSRVGRSIPTGPHSYAVIMTPAHSADELVLRQLVRKKFRYLGMMGSPTKVKQIFRSLRKVGVPERSLKNVHAPIGLPISSHTPAEIAISIAGQIIQVRNG